MDYCCYVLTVTERETGNSDVLGVYDNWDRARAMVLAWLFDEVSSRETLVEKETDGIYEVYMTEKHLYKIEEMEMNTPMY